MRSLRASARLAVLMLAACGGGGEAVVEPPPTRLVIAECLAPDVVPEAKSFRVEVRVDDAVGVASVEMSFDGMQRVLPASGKRTERFEVEFTPTRLGTLFLDVVAVGTDGVRGASRRTMVDVTDLPVEDDPFLDRAAFADRVATWEREGRTPDETYPRGPEYAAPGVPAAFPIDTNWWLEWMEAGGAQPFQWAEHCPGTSEVTPNGEVLQCWLAMHPEVRQQIVWVSVHLDTGLPLLMPYSVWSTDMKEDLENTFFYIYTWLASSLKTPLVIPPDPSISMIPPTVSARVVALNHQQAWVLYVATLAHCLALEIGGFVPWSILSYHPDDLRHLLSSRALFKPGEKQLPELSYTGFWTRDAVHAFPKTSFQFFVDQDIIRPNHYATITRLLGWSGEKLFHSKDAGGDTAGKTPREIAYMHWQYYGGEPIQRMLAGTVRENETKVRHWTYGCSGTSKMYASILRALNIPAYKLHGDGGEDEPVLEGHTVPVFPTIGQTLSHADEVLHLHLPHVTPPPAYIPPSVIFVDWATFVDWFWTNPDHNVGRQRFHEVQIDVLPDDILDLYCADLSSGVPHAQSLVYARFSKHYDVAGLVARNLWTRLAQKELLLNYCK